MGLIQIAFLSVLLREKRRCRAAKEGQNMPNRSLCVLGSQFNGLAQAGLGTGSEALSQDVAGAGIHIQFYQAATPYGNF